jgi:hypothetical protein
MAMAFSTTDLHCKYSLSYGPPLNEEYDKIFKFLSPENPLSPMIHSFSARETKMLERRKEMKAKDLQVS